MIDGVVVKPLRRIPDERGSIFHILRCDAEGFSKFGEAYSVMSYPGVIRGWHIHTKMTINYAVLKGMIKMVLYDLRKGSKTFGQLDEIYIGENNYCLVTVPPGIANGYKTVGDEQSILINVPDMAHDPSEMERMDPFTKEIPYDWSLKHK